MKELKKHKQGRIILLLLGMFLAGILYSCSQPSPGTEVSLEYSEDGERREKVFRSQKPLFRMRLLIVRGKKLLFQRQKLLRRQKIRKKSRSGSMSAVRWRLRECIP